MKILDNNALNHIHKNRIRIDEDFIITTDIQDEFESAFDADLPSSIRDITKEEGFDNAAYIRNYKEMLNKYGGRSFYNMTGIGDISILALLKTQKELSSKQFPTMIDGCTVIIRDHKLENKIKAEFANKSSVFDSKLELVKPEIYFK